MNHFQLKLFEGSSAALETWLIQLFLFFCILYRKEMAVQKGLCIDCLQLLTLDCLTVFAF